MLIRRIQKLVYMFTSTSDTQQISILKEVEGKVFQAIKCQTGVQQIDRNLSLQEYQMDSLKKMELVVSLEQMFNLDISDQEALKIDTVNDCIVIFNKYMVDKLNRDRLVLYQSQNNNII